MITDKKNSAWVEAVSKLIALTQAGHLKWSALQANEVPEASPSCKVQSAYSATFEGRPLRVMKEHYLARNPYAGLLASETANETRWYSRVALELGVDDGKGWWRCPDVSALPSLLEAIQYQVVGVNDFLNALRDK